MAKSKTEIIKSINELNNSPLNQLKKDPVNNSSGTNHKALMQYNAMLDNITLGAHTNTTIEYAGIEWTLRLLTSAEYISIRKEVIEISKKDNLFDDFYITYLTILKFLSLALTPSPFKTEGKAIFSEEDLKLVNYDVLEELYKRYIDFVQMATKKAEEFTEEEIQALMEIVKKKPEVLNELGRAQLLIVSKYSLNYSQNLAKIIEPE